jgi:hypothetical protein
LGEFKKAHLINNGRDLVGIGAEPEVKATFAGGDVIFVPAWEEHFSHYTVEMLSPSGRLFWSQGEISWQGITDDPVIPGYKKLSQNTTLIPTGMDRYQWHVAEQLSRAIAKKSALICTGKEALKSLIALSEIVEMEN